MNDQDNSGCWILVAIVVVVVVIVLIVRSCIPPKPTPTPTSPPPTAEEPTEPPPTEPEHLGEIYPEIDVVQHAPAGGAWIQLYDDALLWNNDLVMVKEGGTALLSLVDGIELRLGNETELEVSAPGETLWTSIRLFRGGFLGRVPGAGVDEPAEFALPGGGQILIYGTEFMFVYDDINNEAWIANFDGGVDVISGGTTVTVPPGGYTHLKDGQPPDPPLPLNYEYDEYDECESWMLTLESPVALAQLAGSANHDLQFTLTWGTVNDLDLVVYNPDEPGMFSEEEMPEIEIAVEETEAVIETGGEEAAAEEEMPAGGGSFGQDANAGCEGATTAPVETFYYTEGTAPRGTYFVEVHYFVACGEDGSQDSQDFMLTIQREGKIVNVYEDSLYPGEVYGPIEIDY